MVSLFGLSLHRVLFMLCVCGKYQSQMTLWWMLGCLENMGSVLSSLSISSQNLEGFYSEHRNLEYSPVLLANIRHWGCHWQQQILQFTTVHNELLPNYKRIFSCEHIQDISSIECFVISKFPISYVSKH